MSGDTTVMGVKTMTPLTVHDVCERIGSFFLRVLPIFLLLFLNFFGAFLFHIIEEPFEIQQANEADEELDEPVWSFWGSFYYVMTLYTTNGFLHQAPKTNRGKALSLIYIVIVIPIFLYSVWLVGYFLCKVALTVQRFCQCLCCCWREERWRILRGSKRLKLNCTVLETAYVFPVSIALLVLLLWFLLCPIIIEHKASATSAAANRPQSVTSYWDAFWYYMILCSTVGFGDFGPPNASHGIVDFCLVIAGLSLFAMCVHLIQWKLDAMFAVLIQLIDERYKRSLELGQDGAMPTTNSGAKSGLRVLVRQAPPSDRFWILFLSRKKRKELIDHWLKRAHTCTAECQTKESSFEPRMYGVGSIREEFRKSRDDVNSLVASLDFTLRPKVQRLVYKT